MRAVPAFWPRPVYLKHGVCVLVPWQMKWLPIKHREVQSEHFGKRGMSLHGCALLVNRDTKTHGFEMPAVTAIDKERAYPWQMLYFLDALEGVDEQSASTVVCIADSLMARWRVMFPEAKTLSLQAVCVPWLGCPYDAVTHMHVFAGCRTMPRRTLELFCTSCFHTLHTGTISS